MKCLDTDLLVAILRGDNDAKGTLNRLDTEDRNATTVINAFEIFYGANRSSRRAQNIENAKSLLQRLEILPFSPQAAERAGELLAQLTFKGEVIEYRDAMIAGIVLEEGVSIISRNKKHFARIPKIQFEIW
jgi:tRNA(fMet)-specific endonuclease VapC